MRAGYSRDTLIDSRNPRAFVLVQPQLAKPFHRDGWVYEGKSGAGRQRAQRRTKQPLLTARGARRLDASDRCPELYDSHRGGFDGERGAA